MATKTFPVLDGDNGAVEQYGRASTRRGAMRVGNRWFVDPVVDAYFTADDIALHSGEIIAGGAWVACTSVHA